jgi:hypothetical protein
VLSAWIRKPTLFLSHIPHVVGMSAEEQVIRINARWHIAAMQNLHFLGDLSAVLIEGRAVGFNFFAVNLYAAITIAAQSAIPQPASRIRLWRVGILEVFPD